AGAGLSCLCCHDCIRKPLPRRAASCHTHSTRKGPLLPLYALPRGASIAVCVAVPLYGLDAWLSTDLRSSSERHIFGYSLMYLLLEVGAASCRSDRPARSAARATGRPSGCWA